MKMFICKPTLSVEVAVLIVASMGASGVEDGLGSTAMLAHRINDLRHLLLLLFGLPRCWAVCRRVAWWASADFGGPAFGSGTTTASAVGEGGRSRTLFPARLLLTDLIRWKHKHSWVDVESTLLHALSLCRSFMLNLAAHWVSHKTLASPAPGFGVVSCKPFLRTAQFAIFE
jgi:hypothetical protein